MEQQAQIKLSKFGKVNQYVRFIAGIFVGSVIGYPAIPLIVYVILRLFPIIAKQASIDIDQQQFISGRKKVYKIAQGAVLGSFTGFIQLPFMAFFIVQIVDKRLQINKSSFYLKEGFFKSYQSLLIPIFFGFALGCIVNFTDLWIITFVAKIVGLALLLFDQIQSVGNQEFVKFQQNESQIEVGQFQETIGFRNYLTASYFGICILYGTICASFQMFLIAAIYLLWMLASKHLLEKYVPLQQKHTVQQPDEEAYKYLSKAQEELACPISSVIMTKPIFLKECGHTFDGKQIQDWLLKKKSCPLCNTFSQNESMKRNIVVSQIVEDLKLAKDE